MNRLIPLFAAILALAGPLAAADAMAKDGGRGHGGNRGEHRGWDRGGRDSGGWSRGDGPGRAYGRRYEEGRPSYGAPPPAYRVPNGRGPGARRGGYLPDNYRGQMLNDYGRYRLRPPPRGYGWYRSGDSYLLVDRYTGQVFDVID